MASEKFKVKDSLYLIYCVQSLYMKMRAIEHLQKKLNAKFEVSILHQFIYIDINGFLVETSDDPSLQYQYVGLMSGVFFRSQKNSKVASDYFFQSKEHKEEYYEMLKILAFIDKRTTANKKAVTKFQGEMAIASTLEKEAFNLLQSTFNLKPYA